ncbi:hypothetical protein Peur_010999 [Populus x canadensis]
MEEEGTKKLPDLQALLEAKFSSGFLCYVLPSPPPPCLFLFFRPCLLVLTRSPVSLRRNRGITVLLFWFVFLCCSLVPSVCLFPGLSSLSTGFFFAFSPLVFLLVRPLSLVFCFCVLVSLFSFAYCVCVLKTKAKLGYAVFLFSSPVSVSFASPVVPSVLCFFFFSSFLSFFFSSLPRFVAFLWLL